MYRVTHKRLGAAFTTYDGITELDAVRAATRALRLGPDESAALLKWHYLKLGTGIYGRVGQCLLDETTEKAPAVSLGG